MSLVDRSSDEKKKSVLIESSTKRSESCCLSERERV